MKLHLSKCYIVGNHMSRLIYVGLVETNEPANEILGYSHYVEQ